MLPTLAFLDRYYPNHPDGTPSLWMITIIPEITSWFSEKSTNDNITYSNLTRHSFVSYFKLKNSEFEVLENDVHNPSKFIFNSADNKNETVFVIKDGMITEDFRIYMSQVRHYISMIGWNRIFMKGEDRQKESLFNLLYQTHRSNM